MSGFYRKLVEEADRISSNPKNLFEQGSGIEEVKRYKDEAPSAEDLAQVKKDFAYMVKVFKERIAKMERTEAKLKEKLRTAKTPKIKANLEDRLYTETHSIKWHKEWLKDAQAKAKKGDYDSIESAVDDLSAFAWD